MSWKAIKIPLHMRTHMKMLNSRSNECGGKCAAGRECVDWSRFLHYYLFGQQMMSDIKVYCFPQLLLGDLSWEFLIAKKDRRTLGSKF
jgi:hypothetical protein